MRHVTRVAACWRHLVTLLALVGTALVLLPPAPDLAAAATTGTPCAAGTGGTWTPDELNVFWFDVEQGDAQLVVGPTGTTMLIDLGETAWNSSTDTMAERTLAKIRTICGIPSGQVHLDYVMASHLHLDHIGYAGNPSDTSDYGNGIYQLLDPAGLDVSVGRLITRDGGAFIDADGNGTCEVGTNASPSPDVVWHHAGTTSSTARRWICWVDGPAGQADRANIDGKVLTLTNDMPTWPSFDMGPGVDAQVLQANARGVMQADGVTPVSGDHVDEPTPPSENDYSIAIRFTYGEYEYATAGDTDGEYSTSSYGYTYNDVEAPLADAVGDVETMRVNHHGSSHSTSSYYTTVLEPETAVISCGNNSYGHPAADVIDELRSVVTDDGVGADIYMTNNPCDTTVGTIDGAFNSDGDIHLATTSSGTGYRIDHDGGSRSYTAHVASSGDGGSASAEVRVTEARFRGPGGASDELIEIRNTGTSSIDISAWALEGCAASSGEPSNRATVPAGTTLAAGQYFLFANAGYTGAVGPDLTYSASISDSGGARLVDAGGVMVDGIGDDSGSTDQCREGAGVAFPSASNDESFHRDGDGATDTDDNAADFTGPTVSTPTNRAGAGDGGGDGGGGGGTVADVVINEYVPDHATYANEWVELHNPTGGDIDISGLYIDDIEGGGGSPQAIPSGTVIPAGGYHVFEISGYLLNNGGDDVRLLSADRATVYDRTSYTSSADDESWLRAGDGGAWCGSRSTSPTKGTGNPATCP